MNREFPSRPEALRTRTSASPPGPRPESGAGRPGPAAPDSVPSGSDTSRPPLKAAGRILVAAGSGMARWPWWIQVAAIYIAARLASACIFMAAALHQGANPWFPARPDYWNFINI